MLVRLIYVSYESRILSDAEVQDILGVSRTNNARNGLTGLLCRGNGRFLQCIEGGAGVVNNLYSRLMHDPRHKGLALLDYRALAIHEFTDWSMGFLSMHEASVVKLLRDVADLESFTPETLGAAAALELVRALKTNLTPL